MYSPIFEICSASSPVTALLGKSPVRLYPFGQAPQGVVYPYAVWQGIGGLPENYLGDLPDIDRFALQVDIYADTADSARRVGKALRDAIEPHAYITRWSGELKDTATGRYRFSFDVDWWAYR